MFRFIHAADPHLDSPLRGLEAHEGVPVALLRGATRRAFTNLVQLAIDERVDFLVIAGDVYDGDWKDYSTGLFFRGQMAKLCAEGIPVCSHTGLIPSKRTWTGGFKAVGKTAETALLVYRQVKELEEAGFKENELENIDAELKMLNNSEGIKDALSKIYFELKESETPVTQQLKTLLNQLNVFSSYHPDLPQLMQRLQSAQIELQDIADDVDRISNHINYDPQKIEQLNER